MLRALKAEFPEHVFEAGQAEHPEFNDSILPIFGTASADTDKPSFIVEPDKVEVALSRFRCSRIDRNVLMTSSRRAIEGCLACTP